MKVKLHYMYSNQLIEKYSLYGKSVIGVQEVLSNDISKYGVIKPVKELAK